MQNQTNLKYSGNPKDNVKSAKKIKTLNSQNYHI